MRLDYGSLTARIRAHLGEHGACSIVSMAKALETIDRDVRSRIGEMARRGEVTAVDGAELATYKFTDKGAAAWASRTAANVLPGSKRQTIFGAVLAFGEAGCNPRDIMHKLSDPGAGSELRRLANRNVIFKRRDDFGNRYFAQKEWAEKWLRPRDVRRAEERFKLSRRNAVVPEKPSVDQPVKVKSKPTLSGEMIVPEHVKPVECGRGYTHNHRYQCGPDQSFDGAGFRNLGIGRYLEPEAA